MRFGTVSSKALAAAAVIGIFFACGGGDESDKDEELDDANRTASNGGSSGNGNNTVTLPEVCQRQADCPTGYVCVPPAESVTTTVDEGCYNACAPGCTNAGPLAQTCDDNCKASCTRQSGPPEGELNGKCFPEPDLPSGGPGNNAGGGGGSGGSGGSNNSSATIQWANTWTVDVEYTAKCNWANTSHQQGSQKFTVTMQVTGSNSTPKATLSGGYELEGTGGDDRMTLTGDFPMRNWKGETATQHSINSPNEVTIRMTTVESATKATGTIEGNWDASAGWKCTAEDGTITMSR